jgi:hypothetical protein
MAENSTRYSRSKRARLLRSHRCELLIIDSTYVHSQSSRVEAEVSVPAFTTGRNVEIGLQID